jgi:hemin uptake protein HemP
MQSERPPETRLAAPPTRREAVQVPPCHDARALTEGGPRAEICLDGARYLLSITRQGKLILTK